MQESGVGVVVGLDGKDMVISTAKDVVAGTLKVRPSCTITSTTFDVVKEVCESLKVCATFSEVSGEAIFAKVVTKVKAPVGRMFPCISLLRGAGVRYIDLRTDDERLEAQGRATIGVDRTMPAGSIERLYDTIHAHHGEYQEQRVTFKDRKRKY